MAIYENPRRALICVRKSLIQGHFEWTLCTHWLLMLMLNLCSMFTWHWYKISRSQRHQLRIIISVFQLTITIRIFLLPHCRGSSSPLGLGGSDLPVASVISSSCWKCFDWGPPSDEITSGKDPPILGAETPQRLTAGKSKWAGYRDAHKV